MRVGDERILGKDKLQLINRPRSSRNNHFKIHSHKVSIYNTRILFKSNY